MNATILRFGYPETLVAEYSHWVVLLRPSQPALGSLVLAARSEATAFADLDAGAFAELGKVTADIESVLRTRIAYQKLNYLMLMMVDPHVHFHIIPRYEGERSFGERTIVDAGWPKVPSLGEAVDLSPSEIADMAEWLRAAWPR